MSNCLIPNIKIAAGISDGLKKNYYYFVMYISWLTIFDV